MESIEKMYCVKDYDYIIVGVSSNSLQNTIISDLIIMGFEAEKIIAKNYEEEENISYV